LQAVVKLKRASEKSGARFLFESAKFR